MHRILINGAWVDALAAASREIKNPATLAPLAAVPDCGGEDVRRAVAAALAARQGWQHMPDADRHELLRKIGARMRERAEEIAALVTRETGTPLCESGDCVGAAAACFLDSSSAEGARVAGAPGVVAAITAFDSPLLSMARAAVPALAAGSTLVLKPPHQNPLASLRLGELCAGLPAGVVNVVTGGAETGMALIDHPDIDAVDFTGRAPLARRIAAAAGASRKRIHLEQGSARAIIVLRDAPLELAVPGIAWARLRHCGQGSASGTRVYVERSVAVEFADRIHEYLAFLEVGDPIKPETDLGPLISHQAARRVEDQVAHAAKDGARLKLGGRCFQPWGLPGHFFQPTILTDARPGGAGSREPIEGPVLLITPVADAEEAIRFAKHQGGGPGGSIYTASHALAVQAQESFPAGNLEHILARQSRWFPYRDRRRPRAGSR